MEKKLSTSTGYRHVKNPISTEIDRKYRSIALQMLKGEKEESFCIFPQRCDFLLWRRQTQIKLQLENSCQNRCGIPLFCWIQNNSIIILEEYSLLIRQDYGVGAPIKHRNPCLREMP